MTYRLAVLDDYLGAALSIADWSPLAGRAEVQVFHDSLRNEDALVARLADFDALLLMRERTSITASLLERLPRLDLIVFTGSRNGAVDLEAAEACGVTVLDTSTASSPLNTATLTWALILALARGLPAQVSSIRDGGWQTVAGVELEGRTLGVVGLGRIGREVARLGAAFGMKVLAWSPNLTADGAATGGARLAEKAELLSTADVVSLHLVLSERTRHVVDAAALAAMKPSAFLVNTARGGLVDEAALIGALRDERIAGAGLDVFDQEPLPPGHPLRSLPNVVATPHIGFVTHENLAAGYQAMIDLVAGRLNAVKAPGRHPG